MIDCNATWEDIGELVRKAEIGTVIKMSFDAYYRENLDDEPSHIDVEYKKVVSEHFDGDYEWDVYCSDDNTSGLVASGEDDSFVKRDLMFEGIVMARCSYGDGFYDAEYPVKNFEITVS